MIDLKPNLKLQTSNFKLQTSNFYAMDLSLDNEMDIKVKARLIGKGHDGPLDGAAGYTVRLFDKDQFDDDFLGEERPNENGEVIFTIDAKAFGDFARVESTPDLYFTVYKHQEEIFSSKVLADVDLENSDQKFKMGEGAIIDLGTFLVQG